jgi:hypothetical protein
MPHAVLLDKIGFKKKPEQEEPEPRRDKPRGKQRPVGEERDEDGE